MGASDVPVARGTEWPDTVTGQIAECSGAEVLTVPPDVTDPRCPNP